MALDLCTRRPSRRRCDAACGLVCLFARPPRATSAGTPECFPGCTSGRGLCRLRCLIRNKTHSGCRLLGARAPQALESIQKLYGIEIRVRGQPPDIRRDARQRQAVPVLAQLHGWLVHTLEKISQKSALAGAIRSAWTRWEAITRDCDHGALEIDNNAAERALRTVALGQKND